MCGSLKILNCHDKTSIATKLSTLYVITLPFYLITSTFFSYTSYFLLFNFLLCKALRITIVYEMCYINKLALPYNDLVSKLWLCISLLIYQIYYDLSKHDYSYILIGSSIIQK